MCLHFIHPLCDFFDSVYNGPVQSLSETAQRSYGHRAVSVANRNHMDIARHPYGGCAEIVRWPCDLHVFLGIHVPNVHISFLIEMALQTYKRKYSMRQTPDDSNNDTSQGGRTVMVQWL